MSKRKICIVITTRGNYAKMASVMNAIQNSSDLELQLIVGGGLVLPKYGFNVDERIRKRYRIDRTIHFLVEGDTPVTMAKSAGLALSDFTTAFDDLKPNIVVVIADRFECLSIAMAASYMNIPVAHVEGGEVSGSIDESVRHAITKLSHIHFPATLDAARRIERLGEDPKSIFVVGCTSLDVIKEFDLNDIDGLMEVQSHMGVGPIIDLHEPYLLVVQHPVTTEYHLNLNHVNETIAAVDASGLNAVWVWPNMDAGSDGISKGLRMLREKRNPANYHFFKSLPIEHYSTLLNNAACIVGNSSSGIREASFLGVPSINIGTRQTGRERAENVVDVPYDRRSILEAIRRQVTRGRYAPSFIYGDGSAGEKIVEVLRTARVSCQKKISY
jgi:UDP-hydrolysing UDP-N-acetyl-D-glucosamine 2-epimerase